MSEAPPLVAALERFPALYHAAMTRRFCWRLGAEPRGVETDMRLVSAAEAAMAEGGIGPDAFFFAHRGGRAATGVLAEALADYAPLPLDHEYWSDDAPQSMLIDEVEAIWAAIAERDDWAPLKVKVAALRRMGGALGEPPMPAGHASG